MPRPGLSVIISLRCPCWATSGTPILVVRRNKVTIMKYSSLRTYMTGIALVCLPAFASAAPLGFGDTVFLPGTTAFAEPDLAGSVLNDNIIVDTMHVNDTAFGLIGTSVQNRVVRSSTDGTLIFGPRLLTATNITFSPFLIDRVELYNFGDFDVDVNYRADGPGDRGPTQASRSADGDTLSFDFGFPLVGGNLSETQENSYFFSLNTEATAYSLDGRMSVFARHLDRPGETLRFDFSDIAVPDVAPVPLPGSLLMLMSALGLGGAALRRRKT